MTVWSFIHSFNLISLFTFDTYVLDSCHAELSLVYRMVLLDFRYMESNEWVGEEGEVEGDGPTYWVIPSQNPCHLGKPTEE